jgi:Methyltransferase domain
MSFNHIKLCRWQGLALIVLLLSSLLLVYLEDVSLFSFTQERLNGNRLDSSSTSSMYELAKYESFGFFDNIDNGTWLLHKDRAQREPIYMRPGTPDAGTGNRPLWLLINVDPMFTCPNLRRVGGRGDGPKWTCDPHRLVKQPDCLVYSIGSRGIYRFEDGLLNFLKQHSAPTEEAWFPNCEIHVFDPDPKYGRSDDPERKNIHFHPWGLKSSYEPFNRGKFPESFEFLSFSEIQERLGHEHRRLDIFKIDCEGCELKSYNDWLSPSVDIRQVLIETHSIPKAPSHFFNRFFDMGFVPFSKEANTHPAVKLIGELFEWGWIRLHPDFLNRTTSLVHNSSTE